VLAQSASSCAQDSAGAGGAAELCDDEVSQAAGTEVSQAFGL